MTIKVAIVDDQRSSAPPSMLITRARICGHRRGSEGAGCEPAHIRSADALMDVRMPIMMHCCNQGPAEHNPKSKSLCSLP